MKTQIATKGLSKSEVFSFSLSRIRQVYVKSSRSHLSSIEIEFSQKALYPTNFFEFSLKNSEVKAEFVNLNL